MVQLANMKRSKRQFNMSDWVYLKLKPYRHQSVKTRNHPKLVAKYFGPYQIVKKIGKVAYTLRLPASSRIHPTFHVSMLKSHHGPIPDQHDKATPPHWADEVIVPKTPVAVLDKRMMKKRNQVVIQWLVQWENSSVDTHRIMQQFPIFDP
ncbi:uncharacterized protein LOC141719774 [Apium graveolens]|uniref:uncharacterized protein LOC141719774 n=1 Tax=Apium graveolens TaxID=4045 RepID=UPI003D7BCEEC